MNDCSVKIYFPKKILKGAGLRESSFIPAWVYRIKIVINNCSEYFKISSLNSTFANGLRYLGNLKVEGPDSEIAEYIKVVEPNEKVGNNNLILFANNFKLSPMSENIITFDLALYDKFTDKSLENSGNKIPHKSTLNINTYLLSDGQISVDNITSEVMDYEIKLKCDEEKMSIGDETKLYIECKAGQYDLIRRAYLKGVLDSGFKYIIQSSNYEPAKLYSYDNRTILKWNFDVVNPSECKRIAFKIKLKNKYNDDIEIKAGDTLINSINSNGVNNSSYNQCPDTSKCNVLVVE
jgi:hypothetical protein